MINIKQTMCIGCLCEGFMFADMFGIRTTGPVDNIHGYNFKSTLDVFNGKLFDAILSDKIDKTEENEAPAWYDDDNLFRYYLINNESHWNWRTVHNNFGKTERKEEFKKRINAFNNFNANLGKSSFYIYAISDGDNELSKEDFNYTIENLPDYVLDKLIIVSGVRFKIPKIFYKNFRCIHYNYDVGVDENDKVFKSWNKILYAE